MAPGMTRGGADLSCNRRVSVIVGQGVALGRVSAGIQSVDELGLRRPPFSLWEVSMADSIVILAHLIISPAGRSELRNLACIYKT